MTSLRTDERVLEPLDGTEIAGAVRAAREHDIALRGLVDVFGGCGGPVDHAQYDELAGELTARLVKGPLPDGVYLALHGAMATTQTGAAEADLVRRVRAIVGEEVPIVASFDLHAAVDAELGDLLDGIVGFKTCPHVDYEETGYSAFTMLIAALRDGSLDVHHTMVPMITAAEPHDTNDGALAAHMASALQRVGGDIVDVSIFAVQPWLDTKRTSWAVTVTHRAPHGAAAAAEAAASIREQLVADARSFAITKTAVSDVGAILRPTAGRPLLLADSGDSPSAGATGESTDLLRELIDTGHVKVLATVTDEHAARRLAGLPVGTPTVVTLGGIATLGIEPLELDVVVQSAHSGRFQREYPAAEVELGSCVVVTHRNLTLVVTQRPAFMLDTSIFHHVGIDPALFDAVQIKSAGGFRAFWAAISTDVVTVGSRGASTSELATLPFRAAPVDSFVLS